jgi:hypothetical protein
VRIMVSLTNDNPNPVPSTARTSVGSIDERFEDPFPFLARDPQTPVGHSNPHKPGLRRVSTRTNFPPENLRAFATTSSPRRSRHPGPPRKGAPPRRSPP